MHNRPTALHWIAYAVGVLVLPPMEAALIAFGPRRDGIVDPAVTVVAATAVVVVSLYGGILFTWLARWGTFGRPRLLRVLALLVLWGALTLVDIAVVIYVGLVVGCVTGLSCL